MYGVVWKQFTAKLVCVLGYSITLLITVGFILTFPIISLRACFKIFWDTLVLGLLFVVPGTFPLHIIQPIVLARMFMAFVYDLLL